MYTTDQTDIIEHTHIETTVQLQFEWWGHILDTKLPNAKTQWFPYKWDSACAGVINTRVMIPNPDNTIPPTPIYVYVQLLVHIGLKTVQSRLKPVRSRMHTSPNCMNSFYQAIASRHFVTPVMDDDESQGRSTHFTKILTPCRCCWVIGPPDMHRRDSDQVMGRAQSQVMHFRPAFRAW